MCNNSRIEPTRLQYVREKRRENTRLGMKIKLPYTRRHESHKIDEAIIHHQLFIYWIAKWEGRESVCTFSMTCVERCEHVVWCATGPTHILYSAVCERMIGYTRHKCNLFVFAVYMEHIRCWFSGSLCALCVRSPHNKLCQYARPRFS